MADLSLTSPLIVHLPPDLKQWLHGHAEENGRNMTKQVVEMLKRERERSRQTETQPS